MFEAKIIVTIIIIIFWFMNVYGSIAYGSIYDTLYIH